MKKSLALILLSIMLLFPLVSAVDFTMDTNLSQGQTIVAKIVGDFSKPILKDNIEFYRGHVRVSFNNDVIKVKEAYYIYADTIGKNPENYSLRIKNIEYKQSGKTITEDLEKNFTISNETADFAITSGFITSNEDFSINLENLKDETIIINYNISTLSGDEGGLSGYEEGKDYELEIFPGSKNLDFQIEGLKDSTSKLITFYNDNFHYAIPLSLFVTEEQIGGDIYNFDFFPEELDLTVPTGESTDKIIYIYNRGSGTLNNVRLELSESLRPFIIKLSDESFGQILPNSNANFNMTLISGSERTIDGTLTVTTDEGVSNFLNIRINFKDDYIIPPEEKAQFVETRTCQQLSLPVCLKDVEVCSGNPQPAGNDVCCVGRCVPVAKSSTGKIIGWILLLIVIGAVTWFFFKKYKGVKNPVDLLKFAEKKKER